MNLTDKEFLRYNRHIMMDEIGESGQTILKHSHVMIVGLGGLGCPAALYLAASGVGNLTLVDHDVVDITNLQRQILFSTDDIGKPKVVSARQTLNRLNPHVEIQAYETLINELDPGSVLHGVDIVLDCTDNIAARHYVNRIACQANTKLVTAAAIQAQGQLISFDFSQEDSPCYQCLYPEAKEQLQNCQSSGVLSSLLGVIGSLQATEAIKLLLGMDENLNRLLTFNAWGTEQQKFNLAKAKNCENCQNRRTG